MIPTFKATRSLVKFSPSELADDYDTWYKAWAFSFNEKGEKVLNFISRVPGWGPSVNVNPRVPTSISPQGTEAVNPKLEVAHKDTPYHQQSAISSFVSNSPVPLSSPVFSAAASPSSSLDSSFASFQDSVPPTSSAPIFVNEYFEVRKSQKGGYGAFAIIDIKPMTTIIEEEPLLKTTAHDLFQELEKLTPAQKADYHTLHGWRGVLNSDCPDMAIFKTNRFEITAATGGIFIKSSRFNHACTPNKNCSYRWDNAKGCLNVTTIKLIKAGDEITISYAPDPFHLYEDYGFYCDCPSCEPPAEAKRRADMLRGQSW